MSNSRTFLAFVASGLTTILGVVISSIVQAFVQDDNSYLAGIAIVPLFGFPFIVAAVVGASLVYLAAKKARVVTKRFTIGAGAVLGAAIGFAAQMPMLPVWSSTLIGVAVAAVWWRIVRVERLIPPAA